MFKKFLKATTVVLSMSIIIGVGKPVKVDAASTYVKATANLNIRNERSTSSKIIKTIPKGTVLEVNYCLNNWFSTYDYKYNNKPCYVSADYIELI